MIPLGAYVVISIDPIETVRPLDDPKATNAARSMVPKNYVGYICALRTMFDPKASWGWYEIELLGPGLAVPSDIDFIEPGMSVPVFPTSAHPASRVPLQPSRPLPWRSRYHHTLSPTIVACRIANSETHPATLEDTTHLSRQERSRLAAFFDEDLSRNGLLRHQSQRQSRMSKKPLSIATAPSPGSSSESVPLAPTAPLHVAELADSLSMDALLSIMRDCTPDTSVVVKASCKLDGSTKLADPKEFLQEEARLKRLVEETKNRLAGHTPDGKERTDAKTAGNPHPLKSNLSPNGHAKVPTSLSSKGYFLSQSALRTRAPNPSPTTPTPMKSGPKLLPTPTVVLNDGEVTLCAPPPEPSDGTGDVHTPNVSVKKPSRRRLMVWILKVFKRSSRPTKRGLSRQGEVSA